MSFTTHTPPSLCFLTGPVCDAAWVEHGSETNPVEHGNKVDLIEHEIKVDLIERGC